MKVRKTISLLLCFVLAAVSLPFSVTAAGTSYGGIINVRDYITDETVDCSEIIQHIIDTNPNRTLYFGDGTYLLKKSIITPADPRKSVDLQLSNYAQLKAGEGFEGEAVVRLGGKDAANNIEIAGSCYSLTGGIIDANGRAEAVSIESGRETKIQNLSIKNAVVGIHIYFGANSGSSDADISDVNITGTGGTDSVGMIVEGYDNTFTNMRIGHVHTGVILKGSGNCLRNIHPLYYSGEENYETSCGFFDESGSNIYDYCYSDQFCTGFFIAGSSQNIYNDCFCYWYAPMGKNETAVRCTGRFNSVFTSFRIGFREGTDNTVLSAEKAGKGVFRDLIVDKSRCGRNKTYRFYIGESLIYKIRRIFFFLY